MTDFDNLQKHKTEEELYEHFNSIKAYSLIGLNYNTKRLSINAKSELINYYKNIPTFKEYMGKLLNDMYGIWWFIGVPLAVIVYFFEKRATQKFIDENQ